MIDNLVTYAPAIVLVFLIISKKDEIFSCQLRKLITHNMWIKHILLFLIIFAFQINQIAKGNLSVDLFYSFLVYIWFIFTMRSPLPITITAISTLFVVYFISVYQKKKENDKRIEKIKKGLLIFTFSISTIGFLYFVFLTRKIFKEKWSFVDFWLGLNNRQCYKSIKFI